MSIYYPTFRLERLPEADRHLLTAYYFGGKTETELAKELGVVQQTVSWRLKRAIGRLGKLMNF